MIDHKYIDYKDIEKKIEIKFGNPKLKMKVKRNPKEKIIILLNQLYKRHRAVLSRWFKEDDFLKEFLDADNPFSNNQNNSALTQSGYEPFFNLEKIHFAEVLPKSEVSKFEKKIDSFVNKNRKESLHSIDNDYGMDDCEMVSRDNFMHLLYEFAIDDKTRLGETFDFCRISAESMSDSFIKIIYDFHLNERYISLFSRACIQNVECYKTFFSIKRLKIRNFRFLCEGEYSENLYKKCIVEAIIDEMKYRARTLSTKGMGFIKYPGDSNEFKAFLFVNTNIDKNGDEKFWSSIGIDLERCYFSDFADACVTYLMNDSSDIMCIYKENNNYCNADIFRADASNCFNNILAYSHVRQNCIESLTKVNIWIRKCRYDPVSVWMTLYKKSDAMLELIERFCSEYKYDSGCVEEMWSFRNVNGEELYAEGFSAYIDQEVLNNRNNIATIKQVISEKMNSQNTITSMRLQKGSVMIGFISALIAFLAIFLTLIGENVNVFFDSNKEAIVNVFAIVVVAAILYYLLFLISFLQETILKKIRFR